MYSFVCCKWLFFPLLFDIAYFIFFFFGAVFLFLHASVHVLNGEELYYF